MHPLLKNWKVRLLIGALILSAAIIAVKGIQLGVDFSGGTILIFRFDRPLTPDEMQQAVQIISQRVNWTGLASVNVRGWGDQYVFVELSTSDPQEIEYMKESILRQGKFETVVDGNVVLTGDEIVAVKPATYTPLPNGVKWQLPFVLSPEGVKHFYTGVRGKCDPTGKCAYTFMYIDRPVGAVLLIPPRVAEEENMLAPVPMLDAPDREIPLKEFIVNAGVHAFVTDENFEVTEILEYNAPLVILHPEDNRFVPFLQEHNIPYRIVPPEQGMSWIWRATNLRSVVRLTPSVTNTDPEHAPNTLVITGWAKNRKEAEQRVEELSIILRSGALPAGIRLESEQSVPSTYGRYAFWTFLAAMFASMIAVSLYIAWRYRVWKISAPIILTIFSEILLIFGFAALINWKIDVSSMIGMIAATGTGVDDQIVITDEVLRGRRGEESKKERGILKRIRDAFFIVFATAGALGFVMVPVFFSNIPALTGFALTTIVGILVGITITRPAFAEIIRYVVGKRE
ncbi:MAG: hypothetical protein GXN93_00030 [Candidatus Diapherotrites archaeon]|nr:hypothetical protein [Candidatus Diapherotrites archaeon]